MGYNHDLPYSLWLNFYYLFELLLHFWLNRIYKVASIQFSTYLWDGTSTSEKQRILKVVIFSSFLLRKLWYGANGMLLLSI